jgi:thiol-disulfide isomerase/thioredoxin
MMKRAFESIILICICLIVTSCSKEVTVGGTVSGARSIGLYSFNKGAVSLIQEAQLENGDGSFEFVLPLQKQGLYLIGANPNALYPVFLKKGAVLQLHLENGMLSLAGGDAGEENGLLFKWENGVNDLKIGSFMHKFIPGANKMSYEKFVEEVQKALALKDEIVSMMPGDGGEFHTLMKNKMEADLDFYIMNFMRMEGVNIPEGTALPEFLNGYEPGAIFQDNALLDIPYAGAMLETYIWQKGGDENAATLKGEYRKEFLASAELQQEYLLWRAANARSYDELQQIHKYAGEFLPQNAARMTPYEEKLSWSKPGCEAPQFTAMAPDSTWMKLSDYRGKVVVVDVWATWCEPCRRLMPLYHQLQEEFKGNPDVAFLSVCVGVWVEADLWLKMSREFGITENNFFVEGWKSDFVKDYHISGVPRYMVIDREGKVVSLVAPNPATEALKELVLKTIG